MPDAPTVAQVRPRPDGAVWIALVMIVFYAIATVAFLVVGNTTAALIWGAWALFWVLDLIYVRRRQLRREREAWVTITADPEQLHAAFDGMRAKFEDLRVAAAELSRSRTAQRGAQTADGRQ